MMKTEFATASSSGVSVSLKTLIQLRSAARYLPWKKSQYTTGQLRGGRTSHIKGRGIDFSEVRLYQNGDDVRHMDWQVTARTGKPHIKVYQEERERPVYLIIDYSPSLFFGTKVCFKSVVVAKTAALLGWAAIEHQEQLGAFLFSGPLCKTFKLGTRQQAILPILKALADVNTPPNETPHSNALANILQRLNRQTRSGSLIFIISDFYHMTPEAETQLHHLTRKNHVIACAVRDVLEVEAPKSNAYSITDGQQVALLDTSNPITAQEYIHQLNTEQHYLRHVLRNQQVPLIELYTHDNINKKLQQCLPLREFFT